MNLRNISETAENRSIFKFMNTEQHGPEAVFWIVVDALLLVAIVTGNSLSVAIILRTRRRRRHNMKSNFSDPTHPTHNTSGIRKRNSNCEGVNNIENESPDPATSQTFRPGTRSSSRFVLSLAISDLLVGLSMPFHMVFYIQGADGGGSPLMPEKEGVTLGQIEWTCLLRFVLIALACSASACNLLAIAVDRYLAIVYPLHYCRYMTKKVSIAMIISCWGTALILATVPAYWNRWKTATSCELDDIFTPEYITCVVAPLFSAVVLALTILYWRIGKEARAQLKRLLGADGKGPPWKRFQNGKTYSSSNSTASGKDHNKTEQSMNRQTNKEIQEMDVTESLYKNENQDHDLKNIPKRDREIGSSSYIRKDLDEFKKSNKLPHLQETEEEHYQEEKEKSSIEYIKESETDRKKPHPEDEINILQEKNDKYPTDKVVCSIVKCQSDPNLVSYFEDDVIKDGKGIQSNIGLNNQVSPDSDGNKTIALRHSQIFPINNFTKENQNMADKGVHKTHCAFQINFLKRDKWLIKRKSLDQTYKLGTFNTMPKAMMTNKKHFDKPPELIISLADFIKETNDNFDRNTTNDDNKNPSNKSVASKEISTKNNPEKEAFEESKQNNLLKDASMISCNDKPRTIFHAEDRQESINLTIATDFPTNENICHEYISQEDDEGDNDVIERRASCMRSISSSCSSRGGRRNSTWNIRFPSLTSGTASIRPHVSKSTIVVLLVLGSFILLWLPYLTVSSLLVKGVKLPYTLYRLTFSLAMSNSGVNPIIYGWKNAELKRVFMRFVMKKWHRCAKKWKQRKEQEPATDILNEHAPSIEISHVS